MPIVGREPLASKVSGVSASTMRSSPTSAFSGSASVVVTVAAAALTSSVPSLTVSVTVCAPARV